VKNLSSTLTRTVAILIITVCAHTAIAQSTNGARTEDGRRELTGTTRLTFDNVSVKEIVNFLVETTGKVVIPQSELLSRKVTILNDEDIPQSRALDYVILALQQQQIAVVETATYITLRDIAEVVRQDVPVIGPDVSMLARTDLGNIVEKVYRLRYSSAKRLEETLEDSLPDYASLAIDEDSNQIVIRGNVALLQRMERLINALDAPSSDALVTQTFVLRYADAAQVADNIKELYEEDESSSRNSSGGGGNRGGFFFGGRGGGNDDASTTSASTSEHLRVTANPQQNSVTVLAEPAIITQVRSLITAVWDRPLPEEAVVPRIYDLKNSDPVKVRDLLEGLFGTPSAEGDVSSSQGVGRLAGQFSFQAIPEANRLVVVSKSPDNLFVIDEIIEGIDQPQTVGLPEIIELKHASAEELAEQLNALLAEEGTLAEIRRAETGLADDDSSSSPFASDNQDNQAADTVAPEIMQFWWQRARPPVDRRGSSNLVANIRVVPVWRQNAVMVLAPPEYKQSIIKLIADLDRPGRQVLISAVIAEISLEDSLALGLRFSSSPLTPNNADNAFSFNSNTAVTDDDVFGNIFDTAVLNSSVNLNALFQALDQDTTIKILSEPRIFTADNQEAQFFDGQDIPFITDTQVTDTGALTESFEYRAVGIQLRVRPRITVNRDVDLRINLELSSIQPQATLFGGFIVDRREVTTQLIVADGQTVVISGILRSEESEILRKVPFFGDIPIIGSIFSSTEIVTTNTELVAFITPYVVDNPSEVDAINEDDRERLKELREQLKPNEALDESRGEKDEDESDG